MTNNKGIKSLWGYPLIDSKGRHAIDDVRSNLENNFQKKNDDTLTTTSKTISGAINEVNAQYKDIANKTITTEERTKLTNLNNYDDSSIKNDIQTQKARIDNLTTLKEGSTTGDAELIDARIGADSITYDNIGNAIRKQLNKKLDKIGYKNITPFNFTANNHAGGLTNILCVPNHIFTHGFIKSITCARATSNVRPLTILLGKIEGKKFNSIWKTTFTPDVANTIFTIPINYEVSENDELRMGFISPNNNIVSLCNDLDIKFYCDNYELNDSNEYIYTTTKDKAYVRFSVDYIKYITHDFVEKEEFETISNKIKKMYYNYSFLESDFDFSYNYNSSADLFILDNKIYNFVGGNNENTTYGYIHEWTIDYENKTGTLTKTLRHNIGHVNSVSYCEATNTLICGNGSSNYDLPNKIYIINNFSDYISNGNNVEYSDAIILDVSSENWGSKINVVWGEYNNENYNIIYVITNNNKNVRKVMLNKTDGKFNGNYVVLQEWVNEDVLDVNQGTCFYKGKLYFNIGHGGINVIEYTLLDNGSILMKKFVDKFYDEIGNEDTSIYGQGIDIKNGHLVIGTTKGNRIYNI